MTDEEIEETAEAICAEAGRPEAKASIIRAMKTIAPTVPNDPAELRGFLIGFLSTQAAAITMMSARIVELEGAVVQLLGERR